MIILYDHVHPVGAFAKNAPIDVSDFNVTHFVIMLSLGLQLKSVRVSFLSN